MVSKWLINLVMNKYMHYVYLLHIMFCFMVWTNPTLIIPILNWSGAINNELSKGGAHTIDMYMRKIVNNIGLWLL